MTIGVFRTSLKENERRVPIYPEHLSRFPEALRRCMIFEEAYGRDFGYDDQHFLQLGARLAPRSTLFNDCDLLILPKSTPDDLARMRAGQVLFGWCHCVQQRAMAQAAIDRRITVIAWESMHHWSDAGARLLHVFYKNNEIAGYAAALHGLQLLGVDGHYGPRRRVVILSYGSVCRGAIYALQGRGFNNIHVFSRRPPHLVPDQNPDVYFGQYFVEPQGQLMTRAADGNERPLIEELADADIICNGILQDTNRPILFVREHEIAKLKPRSLIIDISCDEGMGFPFARPTTFDQPTFQIGAGITYYSVDHVPSYLWNAASREISKALMPYLETVASGPDAWGQDPTVQRAIEIREGVIVNDNILSFQRRRATYPHAAL